MDNSRQAFFGMFKGAPPWSFNSKTNAQARIVKIKKEKAGTNTNLNQS